MAWGPCSGKVNKILSRGRLLFLPLSRGRLLTSPWVGGGFFPFVPPSSLPLWVGGGSSPPLWVGGGVGSPLPLGVGGPHVGIFVFHSSSLPLDTRGDVGPPTPLGVGGSFEGIIVCHPPPRRGMTEAWWLMMLVLGLWPLFCRFSFSFFRFRRRPFP